MISILTGCSPEKDMNECLYDVDKTILMTGSGLDRNYISRLGSGVTSIEENLTLLCMNSKGWKWNTYRKDGVKSTTTDSENYVYRPWNPR